MKMMVTVLLATLLLLSGVAFADDCYEVTCTNLDTGFKITHNVYIDVYSNPGRFDGLCVTSGDLSLFFDAMKLQAITQGSSIDAYLKFHGDDFYVVTGIVYCMGSRWSIRGHITDFSECMGSMEPYP